MDIEQKFKQLIQVCFDGYAMLDKDGLFVECNPAYCEIIGYSQEELKSLSYEDITPTEYAELDQLQLELLLKNGSSDLYEKEYIRNDGEKIFVEIQSYNITDKNGEIAGTWSYVRDISERKKSEDELRLHSEIMNRMTEGVNLINMDGTIIYTNPAFEDMFGYNPGEMIGKDASIINYPSVKTPEETAREILATLEKKGIWQGEIQNVKKDGTPFWCYASVVAFLHSKHGKVLISVHNDITLRKHAEKTQAHLDEQLAQAQKMKAIGTLSGGIAHDFNNILSGIMGYSELIKNGVPEDSAVGRDIVEVIRASRRAADLVKQILTFSRKTESSRQRLHPHLIVKEALKLLRSTLPTTINIEEDIDPDSGTILADSTNIHQVVVNLCTNALHAMTDEKGTLRVNLQRRQVSAAEINEGSTVSPGPFIVLSVSDTGCGMDQSTMDRIFEPYFTTKEVGTGTGLGLAVIHGIVQSAQGFINVESKPGEGATFTAYFPALQEGDNVKDDSVDITHQQRGHERILVVDDEAFLVRVTQRQLENRGYRVTGTTDSKDALEKIRTDPDGFDILITDQTMPGLTGAELATAVKEINPGMPIILCTGHSSVLTKEKSLALGIDRYVGKPIMGNVLFDTVRKLLDEK